MLVEQEQDLRKLGEHWRMTIHQYKNGWEVMLSIFVQDGPVLYSGVHNNPKRAFKDAFKQAKEYEENLKKSS